MLIYLWKHRSRSPLFTMRWFKSWVRRIHLSPRLAGLTYRVLLLRARGAKISGDTIITSTRYFLGSREKLSIGEHTFVGRASLEIHDMISIGSFVCINDGVKILTASHSVTSPEWTLVTDPITIGDYAWIATDAIILPGVSIGRGSVVGAGAVVSKSIPDYCVAVGNPARIIEQRRCIDFHYDPTRQVALLRAWLSEG